MRKIVVTILFSVFPLLIFADANSIRIDTIYQDIKDLSARTKQALDNNGNPTALLKISIPRYSDATFSGSMIVKVEHSKNGAIYWVYVAEGAKRIEVQHVDWGTFDIPLKDIEGNNTYVIKLIGPGPRELKTQEVKFDITPSSAEIWIDESIKHPSSEGVITLALGEHNVRITADGYEESKEKNWIVSEKTREYKCSLRKGHRNIAPAAVQEEDMVVDGVYVNESKISEEHAMTGNTATNSRHDNDNYEIASEKERNRIVTEQGKEGSNVYTDGVFSYSNSEMTILRSCGINLQGQLIIPKNVEKIESSACKNCKDLTSVYIGPQVQEIEEGAFKGCLNLRTVTVNSNALTSRSGSFFSSAPTMSEIFGPQVQEYIIGENVLQIGKKAFSKCIALSHITIPKNVVNISEGAFEECYNLTVVTINSNAIIGRDFVFRSKSPMEEIFGPQVQEFIIGGDVRSIGNNAFNKSSALRSITIKKNVESIGNNAFKNCSNLSTVKIPGNVKRLGANSFRNCNNLISVTILEGVVSIEEYAFADCTKLTSFKIPKSLTYIGKNIFEGCTNFTKLYLPKGKKYNSEQIFRSDCKMIRY